MGAIARLVLLFCLLMTNVYCHGEEPWTKAYQKFFNPPIVQDSYVLSSDLEKWNVISFKQLIFCWNAYRPNKGFYEFYGRVRDKGNKKWLAWHKMAEWGNSIQRSFNDRKPGSHYAHVRLEVQDGRYADAFQIRVNARQGASLKKLKMISVSVCRPQAMRSESARSLSSRLESVFIKGVDKRSQWQTKHIDDHRICSPTSLAMVVGFLSGKPVEAELFADNCYDHGLKFHGCWPFNIAHAFDACQAKNYFIVKRLHSFEDLYKHLKEGMPVVVSVRGNLVGAPKSFPNGHLLVVVGYNALTKKVICHDPGFKRTHDVVHAYDFDEFLAAWQRSHRLAYVCLEQERKE